MDIQDFIDDFNNGGTDAKKYFNDYETFFKILERRGLMNQLDPVSSNIGDLQNDLLRYYYETDKPTFYRWLNIILGDVEIIDGIAYLVLSSPGELSVLFCNNVILIDSFFQLTAGDKLVQAINKTCYTSIEGNNAALQQLYINKNMVNVIKL